MVVRVRVPHPTVTAACVVAALVVGTALRVWVLGSRLGALDSDEAVKGLMARHALDGELSVFFWLQAYGGAQDAWLSALVFALFGASVLALKLTHLALWALAAILVWRLGALTLGEQAGRIGAAVFWLWPPYLVWYSTKAFSVFAIPATLAALVFLVRWMRVERLLDALLFGFCTGLAWWALAERTLLLLVPFVAWVAWSLRAELIRLWPALPAFAVGAAPWFAWNVRYDWLSLRARPAAGIKEAPTERLADLFGVVVPTWLGLRTPGTLDWLVPRVLGLAIVAALVAALAVLGARRPEGLSPYLLVALVFPVAYAVSPFTAYVREPRYLVPIAPALALLMGWALTRNESLLGVLAPLALLSLVGVHAMERDEFGAARPADIGPALRALDRAGQTRVLADYWLAYRISFESGERIVATSTTFVRYVPHDELVRRTPTPARVYVAGSSGERSARSFLLRAGFRRELAGELAVFTR